MSKNAYELFLEKTGFEGNEITEYTPEWRQAAGKLGLTEEDVRLAAEEWIPKYYDLAYLS